MKSLIIVIAVLFVFGLGLSINVSAEEGLIPSWIKSSAEFWINDQITDSEFLTSLEFLIENKIIGIPKIITLEQEIKQLKNENKILKDENKNLKINSDVDLPTLPTLSKVSDNQNRFENINTLQSILWKQSDVDENWVMKDSFIQDQNAKNPDGDVLELMAMGMWYPAETEEWNVTVHMKLFKSIDLAKEWHKERSDSNETATFNDTFSKDDECYTYVQSSVDILYRERLQFVLNCIDENIIYTIAVDDYSAENEYLGISVYDIGYDLQSKVKEKLNHLESIEIIPIENTPKNNSNETLSKYDGLTENQIRLVKIIEDSCKSKTEMAYLQGGDTVGDIYSEKCNKMIEDKIKQYGIQNDS